MPKNKESGPVCTGVNRGVTAVVQRFQMRRNFPESILVILHSQLNTPANFQKCCQRKFHKLSILLRGMFGVKNRVTCSINEVNFSQTARPT